MITLNAIEQRLREFADNHFFLKSYSFGSPDDVDLDKFQDFPLMHVVYTGSDYDERTKTYGFELYVFDRPNREENMTDHQREVVSDAEQCLEDIVADIANGGNIFLFTEDYEVTAATVTPLVDERSNLLSGALLDLSIQVPYQRDACNLPIDGVSPEGGVITYQRRGILRVREQDGTPDVQSVNEIRVTNGTLTDEGNGVVSIDTGGVDTLGDLTDVASDVTSEAIDRHALVYDEDSGQWITRYPGEIRIYNDSEETIVKGRCVTAIGAQGDMVSVRAYITTDDTRYVVGVATEEMAPGASGHAITIGEVRGLDTEGFAVGTILQPTNFVNSVRPFGMSPATAGAGQPDRPLPIAMVTRSHANTGRIQVRMFTPGYYHQLAGLSDVNVPFPYKGAILKYIVSGSTAFWGYLPQTSKLIADGATEDIEIYYYAESDDTQLAITQRSDTPSAGNKIVRKIWYATSSQADPDADVWTLYQTLADDATFAQLQAAFEASLLVSPTGGQPVSIKTTWEDVPAFTGLLDTYPGAAAAYSLRLLDADYSGSAINVRRASDNAVQDIGFDANGDLDTSALATFCAGTDGFAVRWYDQSSNGNDAVQATTSAQPKVYDSATGSIGSLRFDGSNDYLQTTYDNANNYTAFWAQTPTSGVGGQVIGRGNLTGRHVAGWGSLNNVFLYRGGSASIQASGTAVKYLGYVLSQPLSANCRVGYNGSTGTTSAALGTGTLENMVIGAERAASQLYGQSDIHEIIIYPSDQSANRTAIETNINDYYTIY